MVIENNFNWNSDSQGRVTYWNSLDVNSTIQEQLVIGKDSTDVARESLDQTNLKYEF
jgi:hypothetical protein